MRYLTNCRSCGEKPALPVLVLFGEWEKPGGVRGGANEPPVAPFECIEPPFLFSIDGCHVKFPWGPCNGRLGYLWLGDAVKQLEISRERERATFLCMYYMCLCAMEERQGRGHFTPRSYHRTDFQ